MNLIFSLNIFKLISAAIFRIILEQSYALYDSEFAESLYPILLFSIAVSQSIYT